MDSGKIPPRFEALRYGRRNVVNGRYFITCCTLAKRIGLTNECVARAIRAEWVELHRDDSTDFLCGIIMPDHVHWLFMLRDRLPLPRVVARFKARTRAALAGAGIAWQPNFFEHRLRPDDDEEHYAQYIFLNPYRAGLIGASGRWSHWVCPNSNRFEFTGRLNSTGAPPPEWIGEIKKPARLPP